MSRHVMIAIPAHDHRVGMGTLLSILRARDQLNALGHTCAVQTWMGDSLLPAARNILLAHFYHAKEFTDLVFWDSDIWTEGEEIIRLLDHPVDVVGGSYRYKSDDENYPMGWLPDPEEKGLRAVDPMTGEPSWKGLIEVAAVPGGFLRITRKAVDALYAKYPERMFKAKNAPDIESVCCLYEVPFVETIGLVGEDYIFCERAREAGLKVWLDPVLNINHSGNKEYLGSLSTYLLNRDAPKGEDAEQHLATLRKVFNNPEMAKMFEDALGETT